MILYRLIKYDDFDNKIINKISIISKNVVFDLANSLISDLSQTDYYKFTQLKKYRGFDIDVAIWVCANFNYAIKKIEIRRKNNFAITLYEDYND